MMKGLSLMNNHYSQPRCRSGRDTPAGATWLTTMTCFQTRNTCVGGTNRKGIAYITCFFLNYFNIVQLSIWLTCNLVGHLQGRDTNPTLDLLYFQNHGVKNCI